MVVATYLRRIAPPFSVLGFGSETAILFPRVITTRGYTERVFNAGINTTQKLRTLAQPAVTTVPTTLAT